MYAPIRPPHSQQVPIRSLSYHVWSWGDASSTLPTLVLLHGWMDVGASYQFMVDALSDDFFHGRHVVAPDWRGFGRTHPPVPTDHYAFVDYLADLDQLLDHYAGGQPVDLVGHSMGGNIAMLYAGVRPDRIRRLVNLEGFGLPASQPNDAPGHFAKWMDEIRRLERGELALKTYESQSAVAQRLTKTNPRLADDKAHWLAQHWAKEDAFGRWSILGAAAHKVSSAQLYRLDETLAIHAAITAPTLSVEASSDSIAQWWKGSYSLDEYHERLATVRNCTVAVIEDAGHMLHHDQPAALARLLEPFCTSAR